MAQITNWGMLEVVLQQILVDVLNEVGELVENRMRYYIDEDVYLGHNRFYADGTGQPTYEFRKSVTRDTAKVVRNGEVRVKVYHDTKVMKSDPENFIHGSKYWSPNDISTYLPEILAFNKNGRLFGANEIERDNYWYDTLDSLQKGGELRKWLMTALRKRGIVCR